MSERKHDAHGVDRAGPGRPKSASPRDRKVHTNLNAEELSKLDRLLAAAQASAGPGVEVTRSDVMRGLILSAPEPGGGR